MRRFPHAAVNFIGLSSRRPKAAQGMLLAGLMVLVLDGGWASAQFGAPRGGAAQPNSRRPNNQPRAPKAAPAAPAVPDDFVPPRPVPDIMTLTEELMTEEEENEGRKGLLNYQKALRNGVLDAQARELIDQGVKYRLYRMTRKEHRQMLPIMRHELLSQDMNFASKGAGAPIDAREYFLDRVTKLSEDLLDNNFHVRLNAVMILGNLTLQEADRRNNVAEKAYTPALEVLLKVFDDESQLEAIKIPAVQGLERICLAGDPSRDQQLRVAQALVKELSDPSTNAWYQMRLAQALGNVGIINDRQPRPFVAQALAQVVVDQDRDWLVRAQAAKALGRAPLNDGPINVGLICFTIVDLAHQGAQAYNQTVSQAANSEAAAAYWKDFFVTLYLAFQPKDADERQAGRGLILRNKTVSTGAYETLLPLVRHVIHQDKEPFTQDQMNAVSDWLAKNPPTDARIAPSEQPIIVPKQVVGNK